jgi:16S rRNA (uracil1498-N3)-methyltransferase
MMNNRGEMLPRFYVPNLDAATAKAVLPAEESHHLSRVLRLGRGDEVAIFDGRGHEFLALVDQASRDAATVTLVQPLQAAPEPAVRVTLTQAVLKGDKMDEVVRDATMAGAAHISPIVTARTEVKVSALKRGHAADRWQRVAIASAKQCRRAWVPSIDLAVPLLSWLAEPFPGPRFLLVEPSAGEGAALSMRALQARPRPESAACLIGPEGGWTPEERQAALAAGCVPATLGALTLRADAVGLAVLAALSVVWGD